MTTEDLLGMVALLVFVGLLLSFALAGRRIPGNFRRISAFEALGKAIERAVEAGERLHLSLGTASVISPESATAFAGLAALTRIARATSMSDRPAIVSAGDGAMSILAGDTLRTTYKEAGVSELYDPTSGRLLGPTPFSYAAGLPSVLADEQVSVHVINGSFGFEAGLATEFGTRNQAVVLGGTDDVQAQSLIYATADDPLVGEEVYASGAYLEAGEMHKASLRAQDMVRFGLIVIILVAAVVETLGDMS